MRYNNSTTYVEPGSYLITRGDILPDPLLTFAQDVQKVSLPYLHAICLRTSNGNPWSYAFRKKWVGPTNEGLYTIWGCETNVSVGLFYH